MSGKITKRKVSKAIHVLNEAFESPMAKDDFGYRTVNSCVLLEKKICNKDDIRLLVEWLYHQKYVEMEYDEEGGYWLTQTDKSKFYDVEQEEIKAKDQFSRRISKTALVISSLSLLWQIISHFISNN